MDPIKPPETQPLSPSIERERQARKAPAPRPTTTREFAVPVGGVVEGRAYWIDGHLVIASGTVGVGAKITGLSGTVEYAKVHEQAWLAGDPIYWYAFGGCLTNVVPPDENLKVGVADKDAPNPSATGFVRLDTIPTP